MITERGQLERSSKISQHQNVLTIVDNKRICLFYVYQLLSKSVSLFVPTVLLMMITSSMKLKPKLFKNRFQFTILRQHLNDIHVGNAQCVRVQKKLLQIWQNR